MQTKRENPSKIGVVISPATSSESAVVLGTDGSSGARWEILHCNGERFLRSIPFNWLSKVMCILAKSLISVFSKVWLWLIRFGVCLVMKRLYGCFLLLVVIYLSSTPIEATSKLV